MLNDLVGIIRAVFGFCLGHVPTQQLGLWAWTFSSVTAVAPCCHVGESQTLPASEPALCHLALLSCLTSPPGPLYLSPYWADSLLSPMHPSFILIPVSPLVTPLGWMPVLGTALGGGKPAQPGTEAIMASVWPFIPGSDFVGENQRELENIGRGLSGPSKWGSSPASLIVLAERQERGPDPEPQL